MPEENYTFLKYWARTMFIIVTVGNVMKQVNDPFWHLKVKPNKQLPFGVYIPLAA